jgi:hypothetical protein
MAEGSFEIAAKKIIGGELVYIIKK